MLDIRPVGYVIGLMILVLGLLMAAPAMLDAAAGSPNWSAFALSGAVSVFAGGAITVACSDRRQPGLSLRQTFLLTTFSWLLLPVFGALPFVFGEPGARYVDAFFEAMSGLTTTGSTVFSGLDEMPHGTLLWRGMLQWLGGIGVVIFAMVFMPMLRVGGMQIFSSEAFETFGKILPRAAEIAASIGRIYLGLTIACAVAYSLAGMDAFEAIVHAMTTLSTGGFANEDASFGVYGAEAEYVGAVFMVLASLPFARFVQILSGSARPLYEDPQVRAFLAILAGTVVALTLYLAVQRGGFSEVILRKSLFNATSILTGTGYASDDYGAWGPFPVTLFFLIGLVGGCAGSTCCSIKVFRFQILFASVSSQIRRLHSPNGVFTPRYGGQKVSEEAISSVMSFLFLFIAIFGFSVAGLAMMGLTPITAISGAATALANIGPGLGPEIGPSGNFAGLPDAAKWLMAALMLMGRLELMTVLVLLTPTFWRG